MEQEIWLPVAGYDGKYEVSNFGRVKSVFTISKLGKIRKTGTILKTSINHRGYETLRLKKPGNGSPKSKTVKIHRLVCLAFRLNPENKPQVNHKDLVQTNNHCSNLEWCTAKENTNHAQRNGRVPTAKPKVKRGYAKHFKKIINIETGEIFDTINELASKIGWTIRKIRRMVSGERYNSTPYRYVGQEDVVRIKPVRIKLPRKKSVHKRIPKELWKPKGRPKGFKVSGAAKINLQKAAAKRLAEGKYIIPAHAKKVLQSDSQGNVVYEYPSGGAAARAMGCNSDNFKKILSGRKGRNGYYKGFYYKYA